MAKTSQFQDTKDPKLGRISESVKRKGQRQNRVALLHAC